MGLRKGSISRLRAAILRSPLWKAGTLYQETGTRAIDTVARLGMLIIEVMKSRPRSVGELIRRALPPQSRDRVFSVELIGLKWAAAVGSELAARSEPASLQDGILTVRVEDVAWGRMIMKLQNEIRPRLNAAMGFRAVKRIRFVIDGKPISQTVPEAPSTFAPEPVEPSSAIIEAAESIGDSGLRESMVRTATRYLAAQIQAGKEKN